MPAGKSIGSTEVSLVAITGAEATIALCDEFGGTRLYIPTNYRQGREIVEAVGHDAARQLSEHFASDVIRIPLARELRARHYRAQGKSNGQIARKLGLTETGVEKLFRRMREQG